MPKTRQTKKNKCTEKEERFCQSYIIHLNLRKATEDAGYKPPDRRNGFEIFQRERVQNRIQELMDKRSERTQIAADNVLNELAKIGFSDLSKAFDENGNLKHVQDIPEDTLSAISNVKVTTQKDGEEVLYVKEIKFWDKMAALEKIGKHLKLFTEKHEHTGKDGGPIQVESLSDEQLDAEIRRQATELGVSPEKLIEMGIIKTTGGESETPKETED